MHDEHVPAVEPRQEIFGPPLQAFDALADEARGKIRGEGKAQIRTALIHAQNRRAGKNRRKTAPDGLDLRQFRHGGVSFQGKLGPCHTLPHKGEGNQASFARVLLRGRNLPAHLATLIGGGVDVEISLAVQQVFRLLLRERDRARDRAGEIALERDFDGSILTR